MATPTRRGLSRLLRRLGALAVGLLLTVGLLELGLAGAWRAFAWSQARANRAERAGSGAAIRVICLGESTTAVAGDASGRLLTPRSSWPAQLEARLRERAPARRWIVQNDGVMGGDSAASLALLEASLAEGPPAVIIAMMGIKDAPAAATPDPWRHSRLVQLWRWLEQGRGLRARAAPLDLARLSELPAERQALADGYNTAIAELGLHGKRDLIDRVKAGIYLWNIGRLAAAEARLREIVNQTGLGLNPLAGVLAAEGRAPEALALLAEGCARRPIDLSYCARWVSLAVELGDLDEAARALSAAQAQGPSELEPAFSQNLLALAAAEVAVARGAWTEALAALDQLQPSMEKRLFDVFPPQRLKAAVLRGRAYIGLEDWDRAERALLDGLKVDRRGEGVLPLLSQVYRATGQTAAEEQLRRELLPKTGRMADVFELAKLYRLTGRGAQVPALLDEAARQIPSLEASYARLTALAQASGAALIVMQYPSFPLEVVQRYAPPAPGLSYVDNLHLFDADPDRYLFEPSFPVSFSHYTEAGAALLAEQAARAVLAQPGLGATE